MAAIGTIYGIVDKGTGLVIYVGQTRQKPEARWAQHRERKTPLSRFLRDNGLHNFDFCVLERLPLTELNAREQEWIARLGTMYPLGLNHRPGGRAKGTSARVREKLSASSKAMWSSDQYRDKASAARKAMWEDPDYRAKMAAKRKAMWEDPVFRAKMAERHKARWANGDRRAEHAEKIKQKWADPDYKARVSNEISKAVSASPAFLAAQSGRIRKRYAKTPL